MTRRATWGLPRGVTRRAGWLRGVTRRVTRTRRVARVAARVATRVGQVRERSSSRPAGCREGYFQRDILPSTRGASTDDSDRDSDDGARGTRMVGPGPARMFQAMTRIVARP